MKFLKEFITECDSFGSEKKFKIKGKEKFQTIFGGLLNFIILIIFLFKFITSFIKFTRGKEPNLILSEDIDPDPIVF